MKNKVVLLIRVVIAMLVFSISGMVLSELLAFALMKSNWTQDNILLLYQVGSKLITILIAFPLYVLVMRLFGKIGRFHWKGNRRLTFLEHLKYLAFAFFPVTILYGIMIILMRMGSVPAEAAGSISSFGNLIYVLLLGCVLMPLVEEIMFRGIMFHTLAKEGTAFAVIVSSLCFAVGHNNPVNMIIGLADGIIFALLADKTGGIKYGYFYHVVVNIVGSIVIPLVMQQGLI